MSTVHHLAPRAPAAAAPPNNHQELDALLAERTLQMAGGGAPIPAPAAISPLAALDSAGCSAHPGCTFETLTCPRARPNASQ